MPQVDSLMKSCMEAGGLDKGSTSYHFKNDQTTAATTTNHHQNHKNKNNKLLVSPFHPFQLPASVDEPLAVPRPGAQLQVS